MPHSCTIKNDSGKDLVIAMAITDGETESVNAIVSLDGRLEVLPLSENGPVIKNGSEATVSLDRSDQNGTGEKTYVQDYNLIACDSAWMYPLGVLTVSQESSNGSSDYPSQTITADHKKVVDEAAAFYQTICLFPTSELAKNFTTALSKAREDALAKADGSAGSAKSIEQAISGNMSAFFNTTQSYQNVTLEAFAAIDNYYNNLPCVWSKYGGQARYYLYTSNGKTTGFAGILTLQKNGDIDITKQNGGYACTFAPALASQAPGKKEVDQTKATPLFYKAGLFTNDANASKPTIALKPGFLLQRLFTEKAADNGMIMTMAGRINGAACIAFESNPVINKAAIPAAQSKSVTNKAAAATQSNPFLEYWDSLIHPKNKKSLIISVLTFLSAIMLIPAMSLAAYAVLRAVRLLGRKGGAASKDDVDDDFSPQIFPRRNAFSDLNDNYSKLFDDDSMPNKSLDEIDISGTFLEMMKHSTTLLAALENYYDGIEEMLKYSSAFDNSSRISLEMLLTDIGQSIRHLGDAINDRGAALEKSFKEECTNFEGYAKTFDGVFRICNAKIGVKAATTVSDSIDLSNRFYRRITDEITRDAKESEELDPEREERFEPVKWEW